MIDPKKARELLDSGANDALLALVTAEEVGLAWCRYAARKGTDDDPAWETGPDGWAAELYHESEFWADEAFVRTFLVTIADAAADDVLDWVGAGPLEDFITGDPDRITWIEAQAARSERFRRALANVWIRSWASEETVRRIERAAGAKLR